MPDILTVPVSPGVAADRIARSSVSDLEALIERIRMSIRFSEVAAESTAPEEISGDIVVLDDVSPNYMMANSALNACCGKLREAQDLLLVAQVGTGPEQR